MNERDLTEFLHINQFTPCLDHSMQSDGMLSKVDAFIAGDVLLRVVVDRGQRFIDLARSDKEVWTDVFTLASRVDAAFQIRQGSFSEAVRVLNVYWPKIAFYL